MAAVISSDERAVTLDRIELVSLIVRMVEHTRKLREGIRDAQLAADTKAVNFFCEEALRAETICKKLCFINYGDVKYFERLMRT